MRSLLVAIGLFAFAVTADARPRAKSSAPNKSKKKATASKPTGGADKARTTKKAKRVKTKKQRVAFSQRRHRPFEIPRHAAGQSLGAPWHGALRDAERLPDHDGYFIRRPWRAFGTTTTVAFVERILLDIVDRFPDIHAIAIGDLSAERGGRISEHSSHQSGRDIDIGLIFTQRPAGYPESFVNGDADNLDIEATFVLVEEFARTASEPGGVHMIFLDFEVQGLLYHWALENGETEEYLAKLFQFPHGNGQAVGLVRHEPYHADHLHVRFRCPPTDSACR